MIDFADVYQQLHDISMKVVKDVTPGGQDALPFLILAADHLNLRLDEVSALNYEPDSSSRRDHLIRVHLAIVESHLYRHGYSASGHIVRILSGNYGVAAEDTKRSIVANGFATRIATVSSAQELDDATPLRLVSDSEYSETFDRLMSSWGDPKQRDAAKMMWSKLEEIHSSLPRHKVGDDFRRVRKGRVEPLPMYVRNELHHPSQRELLSTEAFRSDKRIGFALMEVWLAEHAE